MEETRTTLSESAQLYLRDLLAANARSGTDKVNDTISTADSTLDIVVALTDGSLTAGKDKNPFYLLFEGDAVNNRPVQQIADALLFYLGLYPDWISKKESHFLLSKFGSFAYERVAKKQKQIQQHSSLRQSNRSVREDVDTFYELSDHFSKARDLLTHLRLKFEGENIQSPKDVESRYWGWRTFGNPVYEHVLTKLRKTPPEWVKKSPELIRMLDSIPYRPELLAEKLPALRQYRPIHTQ